MDISETLAPKSEQLDAVDLISGPRTFTVERVEVKVGAEQPVNVYFKEFARPWRPGKNMRRVLAFCWGGDSSKWVGRRVRLFCDTRVVYGGKSVGGSRISHLSHIGETTPCPVIPTRGQGGVYVVEPLVESPDDRVADLRAEWKDADPERKAAIEAEVNQLQGGAS